MSEISHNKKTILVADDDVGINHLLFTALSSKFKVETAFSGKETLDICRNSLPDLILLDVNLGDIDGKEVCKQLHEKLGNECPLIIFISSDQAHRNIISCFEHGADDFIGKPFSPAQVLAKVQSLLKYNSLISSLQSNREELSQIVHKSMSQVERYNAALDIMQHVIACYSEEELASVTLKYFQEQGFSASVYFSCAQQSYCYDSQSKVCSPIVKELFELTKSKQPFMQLGSRVLFAHENCSLLIKNPPNIDSEEFESFKEIANKILQTIEARYEAIIRERDIFSLNGEIVNVLGEISHDLEELRTHKQGIMDNVIEKLSFSFDNLNLEEYQEDYYVQLLDESLLAHDDNNVQIMTLQDRLTQLHSELKSLMRQ